MKRNLTVKEIYVPRKTKREGKASALILQGFWLLHAGFAPGDKVALDVTDGQIVITKGV